MTAKALSRNVVCQPRTEESHSLSLHDVCATGFLHLATSRNDVFILSSCYKVIPASFESPFFPINYETTKFAKRKNKQGKFRKHTSSKTSLPVVRQSSEHFQRKCSLPLGISNTWCDSTASPPCVSNPERIRFSSFPCCWTGAVQNGSCSDWLRLFSQARPRTHEFFQNHLDRY